jgi:hypothetical protein
MSTPQPNPTGPAGVPDGGHLAASPTLTGMLVGYGATDGVLTLATLSLSGTWLTTRQQSAAGFVAAGASMAITAADDDGGGDIKPCGNEPRGP